MSNPVPSHRRFNISIGLLLWPTLWVVLAGAAYVLGCRELSMQYANSIQRQFDLMQAQEQSILKDGLKQ